VRSLEKKMQADEMAVHEALVRRDKNVDRLEERAGTHRTRLHSLRAALQALDRERKALAVRLEDAFAAGWAGELRRFAADCQQSLAEFDDALSAFLAEQAAGLAKVQAGLEALQGARQSLPKMVA